MYMYTLREINRLHICQISTESARTLNEKKKTTAKYVHSINLNITNIYIYIYILIWSLAEIQGVGISNKSVQY